MGRLMGRYHWISKGHLPREELGGVREAEITDMLLTAKLIQLSLFQEQDQPKEVSSLKEALPTVFLGQHPSCSRV